MGLTKKFEGVFTALVTPFLDGEVDYESLSRVVDHQLKNGVRGFVVNGTTAESPTLLLEEVQKIFQNVRAQAGPDVPLIFGAGSNSTLHTLKLSKFGETLGADALLLVVPYYNKPNQKGLYEHFKLVSENIDLPVILYNVPSRTITSLALETIVALSKQPNVVGIKEASGDLSLAAAIKSQVDEDFLLTSGDDGSFYEFINCGGRGIISVCSHLMPAKMTQWFEMANNGSAEGRADFKLYQPLINALYLEANPTPVKAALKMMGLIRSDECRLPLVAMSEGLRPELRALLEEKKLI